MVTDFSPDVEAVFAGEGATSSIDEAREFGKSVRQAYDLLAAMEGREASSSGRVADEYDDAFIPTDSDEDEAYMGFHDGPLPDELDGPQNAPPRGGGSTASSGQASSSGDRVFEKGSRVKIVGGYDGVGKIGEIFWWGESKYGEGMRAGVDIGNDETVWVDEENLGWPDDEIDEETLAMAEKASQFGKGDVVEVIAGPNAGAKGTIFWWGESKFGDGMRAGVETEDGETLWLDDHELGQVEGGSSSAGAASSSSHEPSFSDDDIPF